MKIFFVISGACLLLTTGCSASLDSSLLRVNGSISLPPYNGSERQAVVYPSETARTGQADAVVNAYGPAWTDLQDEYPKFRFN